MSLPCVNSFTSLLLSPSSSDVSVIISQLTGGGVGERMGLVGCPLEYDRGAVPARAWRRGGGVEGSNQTGY